MNQLSVGILKDVFMSTYSGPPFVVQVMDVKRIQGSQSGSDTKRTERYRLVISDSKFHCQAMLAMQLTGWVETNPIEKFALIRVSEHITNTVGTRKVVIICQLEPVGPPLPNLIGSPINLEDPHGASAAPAQPQWSANTNGNSNMNNNYPPPQQQQKPYQPYVKSEPNGGQRGWQQQQQQQPSNTFSNGIPQQNSYNGMQQQNQYQQHDNNMMNNNNMRGNNAPNLNSGGVGNRQQNGGAYGQQPGGNYNTSNNQGGGGGYGGFQEQQTPYGGFGGGGGGGGHSRGILHMDDSNVHITPIGALTPYSGKWTLQARLIVKSAMRHYKNAKGEGRLFSVDLMDNTSDIRGTFFNDDADKFMEELQPNRVYRIRGGALKPANRQYTQTKCEYEITFGRDTTFEPVPESMAPKVTYKVVSIDQIEQTDPNSIIDIIGVVQEVQTMGEVTIKSGANAGNKLAKRDLVVVDQSSKSIRVTLWDQHKDLVSEQDVSHPIIAIKNCKVSDFNGRSLSTTRSSIVELNPDMQEAHSLRGWYDMAGAQACFTSIGGAGGSGGMKDPRRLISSIKDNNLGQGDKPDFFTVRGWVTFIKKDGTWCYPANPANKKKVVEQGDSWVDESTGTILDRPERRYILSFMICDMTGSQWLSAFHDQAITIMDGKTADEIWNISVSGDVSEFDACFQRCHFKPYIFKVRAKSESWNDETRVKCVLQDAKPLDYKEGCAELLASIRGYGY